MMKKTILTLITTFLMSSAILSGNAPTQTMTVEPASYTAPSPGHTFTVDVNITDVVDLFGYEFKVRYDSSVLTAIDMAPHEGTINEPGFIFSDYNIWWREVNDARGYVWLSVTPAIWITEGVDGDGRLATIYFKTDAEGETTLDVDDTSLGDSTGTFIPHDVVDGEVMVVPEFPSYLLVPILVFATLLIAVLSKTGHPKKPQNSRVEILTSSK